MECGSLLLPLPFTRFPFPVARSGNSGFDRGTGNRKRGTLKAANARFTKLGKHGDIAKREFYVRTVYSNHAPDP
jgi:hypothetical protein